MLEIWLLTVVAGAAGGLTVLALLVVRCPRGRRWSSGPAAAPSAISARPSTTADRPGPPAPAEAGSSEGNGFLMLGGLLLMLPGLISDAVGLLLLVPPVRAPLGRYAERIVERRMAPPRPARLGDAFQQARMRRPDGKVVQGEVIRQDGTPAPRRYEEGPRPPLYRTGTADREATSAGTERGIRPDPLGRSASGPLGPPPTAPRAPSRLSSCLPHPPIALRPCLPPRVSSSPLYPSLLRG